MADEHRCRQRYGEAFWRAHHEAWKRSPECGLLVQKVFFLPLPRSSLSR